MVFKVDFAKAYDSIRWDYLDEVLHAFGFGQGDPLAPFLFILVMESLHLSFTRVVEAGIFRGVGVSNVITAAAASKIGCSVMNTPFKYLGVMVGGSMSVVKAWDEVICNLKSRLSKWKLKTLSIGGRLTLLKSVLGSTPIYWMSLFKVPKSVLCSMESIRRNFFNGILGVEKKIAWVKWSKVLAAKKYGGLGVSSFFALNRALLFKWMWRFLSKDNTLWFRFISAMHGSHIQASSSVTSSIWGSIVREVDVLKSQGVDLISHCKRRIGNGMNTSFWNDVWIGDVKLRLRFPRVFALETNKVCSVASKFQDSIVSSFRRQVRGGAENSQFAQLQELVGPTILSNSADRWYWDLNGCGEFCVKDVRNLLDAHFLPKEDHATRWVKLVPSKINVLAWKVSLDRLPTRLNLISRGVTVSSSSCPVCDSAPEDLSHLLFSCSMASDVYRLVCRWWNIGCPSIGSYSDWLSWFFSI
ncbi:RNA-directed DNA polymerase, eukaryota, partial [Tanacetum coccineum]